MTSEPDSYYYGVHKEKMQSYTQNLQHKFLHVTSRNKFDVQVTVHRDIVDVQVTVHRDIVTFR